MIGLKRRRNQRGTAVLESALILVPMVLLGLGTMEIGRAVWTYHTLNNAVKSAVRFSIVHGEDCVRASATCATTVAAASDVFRKNGIGLDRDQVQLKFSAGTVDIDCATLTACLTNAAAWPGAPNNLVGQKITISARYNFRSVLSGFWPGQHNGVIVHASKATEVIQF